MMLFAWNGYKKNAWSKNEVRPVRGMAYTPKVFEKADGLGVTIVDAMDTLYIMNMKKELAEAVEWVKKSFNMNHV
jgi:mannosyl-oligosaccharide alpha-1,2-mannosidase